MVEFDAEEEGAVCRVRCQDAVQITIREEEAGVSSSRIKHIVLEEYGACGGALERGARYRHGRRRKMLDLELAKALATREVEPPGIGEKRLRTMREEVEQDRISLVRLRLTGDARIQPVGVRNRPGHAGHDGAALMPGQVHRSNGMSLRDRAGQPDQDEQKLPRVSWHRFSFGQVGPSGLDSANHGPTSGPSRARKGYDRPAPQSTPCRRARRKDGRYVRPPGNAALAGDGQRRSGASATGQRAPSSSACARGE